MLLNYELIKNILLRMHEIISDGENAVRFSEYNLTDRGNEL